MIKYFFNILLRLYKNSLKVTINPSFNIFNKLEYSEPYKLNKKANIKIRI